MKGGCLCGSIQYEIKQFDAGIANCHCSMCRKFSGSAFGVFGTVALENIKWLLGRELIKEYVSSAKAKRGFCVNCGSSLYFRLQGQDTPYEIALGSLDDEPDHAVDANIYFDSKPGWSTSYENLPSHVEIRKPFSVQRIDHVVFRVSDLSRSIEFYRTALGCDVVRQREDLGLVHLRAGASMIDLVSVDGKLGSHGGAAPAKEGRNVDHLCLRIEPFKETELVAHLSKHGLAPFGRAEVNFGAEGDGLSLYFLDPDGNVIELKGPSITAVESGS